jgi:hypothetical protein
MRCESDIKKPFCVQLIISGERGEFIKEQGGFVLPSSRMGEEKDWDYEMDFEESN